MTPIKLLSIGLVAATTLATPAMAHDNDFARRHVSENANASASLIDGYTDHHVQLPELRAHALATAPGDEPGGVCDVGDNPMIC
jgi:hypothetical protein